MNGNYNPKEIAIKLANSSNNPMLKQLVQMAENERFSDINSFAQNIFKEMGKDFEKEFGDFINQIK